MTFESEVVTPFERKRPIELENGVAPIKKE
jgi:hypothetical protein